MISRRRLTWTLLLAAGIVGAAVGCGNDLSPNDIRRPTVIEPSTTEGGAAGAAAGHEPTGAAGGSSEAAGAGGQSGASGASNDPLMAEALGRSCEAEPECPGELTCLTDTSHALDQGSPPGGVCTLECGQDSLDCERLGGRCLAFGDHAYCMRRCAFGSADKCDGRSDFACEPTYRRVEVACDLDRDCGANAVCRSGTCHIVYPLCLPRCNGPQDCVAPAACDPVSGECIDDEPSGKPIGADCDPSGTEKECRGVCLSEASGTLGRCHEFCTLGVSDACGASADCVLTLDSAPGSGPGDVGACATRCSCDDTCDFGLDCVSLDGSATDTEGHCGTPSVTRPPLDCTTPGSGGAPAGP